jgi:hypothetical protein
LSNPEQGFSLERIRQVISMCEDCNEKKELKRQELEINTEELKNVKGFHKIAKPLGNKKYEDLSGQKFFRLTAIKPVGRNKGGGVLWLCKCECSNYLITLAYSLKRYDSKSCGCYKLEQSKRFDDLTGRTFGRLTVIRRVENRGNRIYYEAQCSCGNKIIVRGSHLKQGLIKSCKCYNKERTHEIFFKDLTGKKIGRLLITGIAELPSDKNNHHAMYFATCDCGNKIKIRGDYLVGSRPTLSCGCLHKDRMTEIKLDDLTGKKFGELTVLKRVENSPGGETRYLCSCSCGSLIKVTAPRLKAGQKSCGCIRSKGEYKIAGILKENNIQFLKQKEFDDIEGALPKGVFKFDFYIEDKYLVEYDGSQHFIPSNKGWNDLEHFEKTQRRDECKNNYCKEKGIPLIRIPYTHLDNICLEDLKLETTKFRVV